MFCFSALVIEGNPEGVGDGLPKVVSGVGYNGGRGLFY